jgi:hypothetical protein
MLTYENSIQFAPGEPHEASLRNFYAPEEGFVWSSSVWGEITFDFSATPNMDTTEIDLILDCDVFRVGGRLDGQSVLVYLNGLRLASHFITQRMQLTIRVGARSLKHRNNVLTLDTPDSRKPSEFGSADDRRLGMQLFSMRIRPTAKGEEEQGQEEQGQEEQGAARS